MTSLELLVHVLIALSNFCDLVRGHLLVLLGANLAGLIAFIGLHVCAPTQYLVVVDSWQRKAMGLPDRVDDICEVLLRQETIGSVCLDDRGV
jgi:hypothetical protein